MADLTPKTISELTTASSPNDNDLFAISRSSSSMKIAWSALKAALPQLGSLRATQGSIGGGASASFSLATYARGVIICSSAAASKQDLIIYYSQQNNNPVAFSRMTNAGDLTVTSGANTLTITASSGAQVVYTQITW